MAKKIGTSQFTHQDDAVANIHTTDPNHTEAHVYGGNAPEKDENATVVLGPPAFGSPDVRTLGHIMNPEVNSVSAPKLAPEFAALQSASQGDAYSEEELNQMSKADLVAYAEQVGVDVNSSMKKQEIVEAIASEYGVTDEDEDAGTEDDDLQSDAQTDNGDDQGNQQF